MLVLSRTINEKIIIYTNAFEDINIIATVSIVDVRGDKVRLGFEANRDIIIHREEVFNKVTNKN